MTHVQNRCYSKLISKLGPQSQWAVNALECREAVEGIGKALNLMRRPYQAFAKGASAFGRGLKEGMKGTIATGSDLWLLWHFGLQPLYQDIYALTELISNPIKPARISASARGSRKYYSKDSGSAWKLVEEDHYDLLCRMGLDCVVRNPNLHLASQLGLTNPASVAYELIPYSFVLDWVLPLGPFLTSLTDFSGLDISNAYMTKVCKGNSSYELKYADNPSANVTEKSSAVMMSRVLGLPTLDVSFDFRPLSLTRAATAASLAFGRLLKGRSFV